MTNTPTIEEEYQEWKRTASRRGLRYFIGLLEKSLDDSQHEITQLKRELAGLKAKEGNYESIQN